MENTNNAQLENTGKPELLSPAAAAKFLGRTRGTLAVWRATKRYPLDYYKVGGAVMYAMDDLIRFIAARKVVRREPAMTVERRLRPRRVMPKRPRRKILGKNRTPQSTG